MAASYRCALCDIDWPLDRKYKLCPQCGKETYRGDLEPLSYDEAKQLAEDAKARAEAERKMDEAFDSMWAKQVGIDLTRTAVRA